MSKYKNKTLEQLQDLLKEMNLPSDGKREELIDRLQLLYEDAEDSIEKNDSYDFEGGDNESNISIPEIKEKEEDGEKVENTTKNLGTSNPASEDLLKKRAERFGIVNKDDELKKRAERFGIVDQKEKLKSRAERFGIVDQKEKLKSRAEKFGIVSEEEKKENRAKRFGVGDLVDEEKLKSRKERFGEIALDTEIKVNKRKRNKRNNNNNNNNKSNKNKNNKKPKNKRNRE